MHPNDEELRAWRSTSEDNLIERKTFGDSKDWLKTVVAFANSAAIGKCAVLYIGVKDDGSIEGTQNLDAVQKSLDDKLKLGYPPLDYATRVLSEDGRQFLCVLVPGSERRPHFAGPAYVRVGSRTVAASGQQYDRLIAESNSKAHSILRHLGRTVRVHSIRSGKAALVVGRVIGWTHEEVVGCTAFAVTLRPTSGASRAIALDRVDVLENTETEELTLEVRQD